MFLYYFTKFTSDSLFFSLYVQILAFIIKLNRLKGSFEKSKYTFAEFKDEEDMNVDTSVESKMSSTGKNNRGTSLIFAV